MPFCLNGQKRTGNAHDPMMAVCIPAPSRCLAWTQVHMRHMCERSRRLMLMWQTHGSCILQIMQIRGSHGSFSSDQFQRRSVW